MYIVNPTILNSLKSSIWYQSTYFIPILKSVFRKTLTKIFVFFYLPMKLLDPLSTVIVLIIDNLHNNGIVFYVFVRVFSFLLFLLIFLFLLFFFFALLIFFVFFFFFMILFVRVFFCMIFFSYNRRLNFIVSFASNILASGGASARLDSCFSIYRFASLS